MPTEYTPKHHITYPIIEKHLPPSEPLSNLRLFQICRDITRHGIFPLMHGRFGIAPTTKIPIGRDLGRLKTPNRTAISGKPRACLISFFFLFAALFSGNIHAQESVNIAWDTHSNPDVAGYIVYFGTESGQYSTIDDVANSTTATFSSLTPSTTYYCAVQVYNTAGLTSALSPELIFITDVDPVATDFESWAQAYPGVSDPDADSDGDGLSNNEERIWGLDPTSGASSTPFSSLLDKTSGIFSYTRRNPGLTGQNYRYEWSTRLDGDWTAFTPVQETASGTIPVETVDVTVDSALLSNPKLFVRIAGD